MALEFMEVPASDPRWLRAGLFGSYAFGPPGRRLRVVLIDDRYFATPPKQKESDLLGLEQQAWLAQTLLRSKAQVHLIVSGIQVLPDESRYEKWANFPRSREWLLDFIQQQQIPGVIFLSGDRHIHEISQVARATRAASAEITGGLTTHGSWGEPNAKQSAKSTPAPVLGCYTSTGPPNLSQ